MTVNITVTPQLQHTSITNTIGAMNAAIAPFSDSIQQL